MSISEKLMGMYEERTLQMIQQSWCLQDKHTRKSRLATVTTLIIELENIKRISTFSAALGESIIEAVIQGDWYEVEQVAEFLTFRAEREEIRSKFSVLWDNFRVAALTACAEEKRRLPGRTAEAH